MVETGAYVLVYLIHYTASFLGELIGTNYNYVPLLTPSVTLFFEIISVNRPIQGPVCGLKVIIIPDKVFVLCSKRGNFPFLCAETVSYKTEGSG